MKILVTGNLGYIGPVLGRIIKNYFQNTHLTGIDSGLFVSCITNFRERIGDTYYDKQYYCDIRDIKIEMLENYDVVINLAAISNDPIGKDFENATYAINYEATLNLAILCHKARVKRFIFASSCSMYGQAGEKPKTELDQTSPLTAYAKSKIGVEQKLKEFWPKNEMEIICLRFATACGVSDRTRLDLVLNDFVASAIKYKKIRIQSDGTPWRPLIDVSEMAKSIIWASTFEFQEKELPLSINIGNNNWNFTVKELAEKVKEIFPNTAISINKESKKDKRSYKVDFSLYERLGSEFYPSKPIEETIIELGKHFDSLELPEENFSGSNFIRLNHIKNLIQRNELDDYLRWR